MRRSHAQIMTNCSTRVVLNNYKASYLRCDERCRDLGNRDHVARTFAEPAQHGQCRHHRMAFQRADVLCWTVRDVLHRALSGRRRMAPTPDRAEPGSGGAGDTGADRVVLHLSDGRLCGRAGRHIRAAALVCHHLPDGPVLRTRPGLRVHPRSPAAHTARSSTSPPGSTACTSSAGSSPSSSCWPAPR